MSRSDEELELLAQAPWGQPSESAAEVARHTFSQGDLPAAVAAAFASDGTLARTTERFQPRSSQTEMALAVARTVEEGGALVVEAGTGVGKTYAYLVPALLSGERVLLSTATNPYGGCGFLQRLRVTVGSRHLVELAVI